MVSSPLSILLEPHLPPKAELQKVLRPYGFKNLPGAWRELSSLAQSPFDRTAWAELLPAILPEFSKSPDPDLALRQFSTYAGLSFHKSQLFEYLRRVPAARQALCRVFGFSPPLGNVLFREPALLYWLFEEDGLYARMTSAKLRSQLDQETASVEGEAEKLNALRRVKRREMLRIGIKDLMGLCDVKDLTRELSDLADVFLEAAVAMGRQKFLLPAEPAAGSRFAVIGMGKLGGGELNYSSDIDLLFIYETGEKDKEAIHRRFNDLAEWVISALTEMTPFGNLFRVDMRLRPEGVGDMAKSLESYLEHYETRSQPWELQALLKARPCAGDLELGWKFLREVEPLIYRKNFDSAVLREMREIMDMIRRKVERKGRTHTQVKLGRGGIREIEFIVQLLQLVHGGRDPQVRRSNTLEALEALGRRSLLLKADMLFLSDAYRFLRNVEHHLQMVHGLQTHTLPRKAADLERLAKSLGFKGEGGSGAARKFKASYSGITSRVRNLYNEVFRVKARRDPSAPAVEASLAGDREALEAVLTGGFFFDRAHAASNLLALARRFARSAGSRGEALWAAFLPELFKLLKKVPHPDRALNQLENFLRAASLPDLYARYLSAHPPLFQLLLELFSNSLFLSQTLIRHPGNFDIVQRAVNERSPQSVQDFLDTLEDQLAETADWEGKLDLLRDVRDGEILRVGLQDLLGRRELFDCFAELSRLATALSRSALGMSAEKTGVPRSGERPAVPKGFCAIAMGKLGAREMNYGSDLDLMFVYGDAEAKETGLQAYLSLAETFTKSLASPTTHGIAYKVDARLRPMGREAQMAHSVEAFRGYFRTYAQVAERLAYTRAVFLAGDRKVGTEVMEEIERFTYGKGLTRAELEEIYGIRGQMEEKGREAEGLEIKVSPGGIVDIEFFVQILQVAHGHDHPLMRIPHLPTAMAALKEGKMVPPHVADELLEAYRFFRLLEARHRMVRESADNELPKEPERLIRLAWRAGLGREKPAAEKMVERIRETQRRVREYFKRLPEWILFQE